MFTGIYDLSKRQAGRAAPLPGGYVVSQRKAELDMLVDEYTALNPERILEIGSQQGGTLYYWLQNARYNATIVSIDMGPAHWKPPDPHFDNSVWQEWVKPGTTLHAITGDSHDVRTLARVKELILQVDFLFIDADHTYEGVRKDFMMYGPLVRRGGIIALHDLICPGPPQDHIQVGRLWREIQQAGYRTRELYASPGHRWGGIGVVYV